MTIPIEIPGLDTLVPQISEGRIVIVEGGADLTNSFFVRTLGATTLRQGRPVSIVTSKDAAEVREALVAPFGPTNGASAGAEGAGGSFQAAEGAPVQAGADLHSRLRVVALDAIQDLEEYVPEGGLLGVDSFSYLTLDLEAHQLSKLLRRLHASCRRRSSVAALATDRGMFHPRSEAIAIHLADGMVQFHTREGPEGLLRFLRIPKWTDGRFLDRNIYYDFDGKRLAIDLRQRVI